MNGATPAPTGRCGVARHVLSLPPVMTEFVILPEVVLAMAYFLTIRIWNIWKLCTLQFPTIESGERLQLVTGNQFAGLTFANVAFLVLFAFAVRRVRRSSRGLKRGHYAGLAIGVATLVLLQIAVVRGHWMLMM